MTQFVNPLQWPADVRRKTNSTRINGKFAGREPARGRGHGHKGALVPISLNVAIEKLMQAVALLAGYSAVICTDLYVKKNGEIMDINDPKSSPAVCVIFYISGKRYRIGCDKYKRFADNIAGAADYLTMVKRMSAMGCGGVNKVLTGFEY